ncbi:MAG: bifunctional methylenetetrahydrofolate dehydrogenase/methenyltetrahydrofolate cyclohydrolase FolD [Nitrospinae bacterium]|nr:bifunctional methylenetetrahydrofolate dehydrogenase/methenyltetrahydrofolate cyclohydrolase FolD [Nitrospinota bacterium]MZH04036.1 bifunctional methylenetetrahydrofolate dehydrogenase/methenyltetrahydrofolate cyclohydrolase FolD [Nitrospinota bacterium]MZH13688.1 bifunctional methylenetetrahydrofolate dehydrogenase/methenyltetrahydrofolate cyclohydrolase FolD [Nitrospinota bacterium]
MVLIDGKKVSAEVRNRLAEETKNLKEKTGKEPGLATVLVGDDPASAVYVRNKNKTCRELGFQSFENQLSSDTTEEQLLSLIDELNSNPNVHGILVQLPLPDQIDSEKILQAIDPKKDVDGFHPVNVGKLVVGNALLTPCTPTGIIELLDHYGIEISGKHAVIVGRSNIVGKPVSMLLLQRNATITICHSRTRNLEEVTRGADILIAAVGRAHFVTENMVSEGAVVIDVGINRVDGKLTGDVDFEPVSKKASYITPVPGGVGPMTIALLMENTLKAFKDSI